MKCRAIFILVGIIGFGLTAIAQVPFRIGLQTGVANEQSSYRWIGAPDLTTDCGDDQNGFLGMEFAFPLHEQWEFVFSPHYGQRNYPQADWSRASGVNYAFEQDGVDYLALPMTAKYFVLSAGLLRPFVAAGIETGMNLSHLSLFVTESSLSDEPPFKIEKRKRLYLNQLFGSGLLETGLDIQASESWSVLLAARFSWEWTPLLDDPSFTWEAPTNWKIRFAILYTIDI
jgi:hypothetical protein